MAGWGPWFLWGLFAVILVWEEVWDLPNTAYLSAWLLIIITVGESLHWIHSSLAAIVVKHTMGLVMQEESCTRRADKRHLRWHKK